MPTSALISCNCEVQYFSQALLYAQDDPDPTNIDWEDWKKKVDPEMVEMFKNGLKRARRCCCGCLSPLSLMPEHLACFSVCAAGLKIPRIVPIYEDVDAMFEPILEDTKELMEYSAKRAAELELELAKVDYELVCTATSSQGFAVGNQGCF